MKDMFNRRQRFSLRKYSFGVCSVLLGTALFLAGAQTVSADENEASTDAVSANAMVPTAADASTGNTEAPTAYAADAALPTSGVLQKTQANKGIQKLVQLTGLLQIRKHLAFVRVVIPLLNQLQQKLQKN